MKKRKFTYFWATLLVIVITLASGLIFACSGGGEDDYFDPDAIIGTWSNPAIVAETDFYGVTEATAGVELTINEDGTLSLEIRGILVEIPNNVYDLDFSTFTRTMTGTWEVTDNDYVMRLDDNGNVTNNEALKIKPVRENGEVVAVTLSFSITYTVMNIFVIPISMSGAMLYAGPLGTE